MTPLEYVETCAVCYARYDAKSFYTTAFVYGDSSLNNWKRYIRAFDTELERQGVKP